MNVSLYKLLSTELFTHQFASRCWTCLSLDVQLFTLCWNLFWVTNISYKGLFWIVLNCTCCILSVYVPWYLLFFEMDRLHANKSLGGGKYFLNSAWFTLWMWPVGSEHGVCIFEPPHTLVLMRVGCVLFQALLPVGCFWPFEMNCKISEYWNWIKILSAHGFGCCVSSASVFKWFSHHTSTVFLPEVSDKWWEGRCEMFVAFLYLRKFFQHNCIVRWC